MGQALKPLVEWALTPFIVLSCFFQSSLVKCMEGKCKDSYIIHSLIQILYSILISFSSGFVLSIAVIIGIALRYDILQIGMITLIWIPLFLSIIFMWVVVLNYKNREFSLPFSLFSIWGLIINSDLKIRFWETLISIFIMPLLLCIIPVILLAHYNIPYEEAPVVSIIIFLFCFFVSLLIYSESTKDDVKRMARQLVVWLLIFIGFMVLTIYQVNEYLIQGNVQENIVSVAIAILGLALTMTAVIDKIRTFHKESFTKYEAQILESLILGIERYSFDRVLDFGRIKKAEFIEVCKTIKLWWKTGKKLKVIQVFLMGSLPLVIFNVIKKNEQVIDNFFNASIENIRKLWVGFFGGNEELSAKVFFLIIAGYFMIKSILDLIRKFKGSNLYDKTIYIDKVLMFLLVGCMVLGTILTNIMQPIVKWIATPIFILLGISSITSMLIEKIEKRKQSNKRNNQDTNNNFFKDNN